MNDDKQTVWILSSGSGDDGDEWDLLGIYHTEADAIKASERYCAGRSWACSMNEPYEQTVGEDCF